MRSQGFGALEPNTGSFASNAALNRFLLPCEVIQSLLALDWTMLCAVAELRLVLSSLAFYEIRTRLIRWANGH